ncbi:MAG TPA: hypothetical protein VF941_13640, partial [Clostridia bacterium]
MNKIKKVLIAVLIMVVISSVSQMPSFASTSSQLDLTTDSYKIFEYHLGLNFFFTNIRNVKASFQASNTDGPFSYVETRVYKKDITQLNNLFS